MYQTKLIGLRISLRLLNRLDVAVRKAQRDPTLKTTRNGIIIRALEEYLSKQVLKQ